MPLAWQKPYWGCLPHFDDGSLECFGVTAAHRQQSTDQLRLRCSEEGPSPRIEVRDGAHALGVVDSAIDPHCRDTITSKGLHLLP